MSLDVHFKSQKRKALLIMDNFVTHSLQHVGRGESFGFQTCSSTILLFLIYHHCYKCGTNLGSGNNCFIQSLV